MREIEFRGKWGSNGKWIYGSLVAKRSGERLISSYNKMLEFEGNYVRPKTVGQYTGMEDKNGNKIFEGDILKSEKNNPENPHDPFVDIGAIRWQNGCFWFGCIDRIDVMIEATEDFEVIGNIHDNPELLESNKNPFKNREDECQCRCNCCMAEFMEGEITIKDDVEYCPDCGETGYIQDGLEGAE